MPPLSSAAHLQLPQSQSPHLQSPQSHEPQLQSSHEQLSQEQLALAPHVQSSHEQLSPQQQDAEYGSTAETGDGDANAAKAPIPKLNKASVIILCMWNLLNVFNHPSFARPEK